jgi:hypothetical protein
MDPFRFARLDKPLAQLLDPLLQEGQSLDSSLALVHL